MRKFGVLMAVAGCFPVWAAKDVELAEDAAKARAAEPAAVVTPVAKTALIEIAAKPVPYRVTAGKLPIRMDEGKSRAEIFHVSYERTDVSDPATRPVLFAFNGGPGSSAVWLHIGVLGPKIVNFPGNGTLPATPPNRLTDNPSSILDVCDLVFIDPVSTGYSRAENPEKSSEFHGVGSDIESTGEFIRRWVAKNDRWASPKFLLGESYGGIRAAGLSDHLQSSIGMQLNGVILLSTLLDFATLQSPPGHGLSHVVFLPSYCAAAAFHRKISENHEEALQKCREFARSGYAAALLEGSGLAPGKRAEIAAQLAGFTGIPAEIWLRHDLRIDPQEFRAELLRAEGRTIGRFDARVAWPAADPANQTADYDPSFALTYSGFSTAFQDYLGREIGYKEERVYEILSSKVNPWKWDSENKPLNFSDHLANAMRENPKLRVLVMHGRTDLATPPEGIAHSLRHLPLDAESVKNRITSAEYSAGHMFYLNPEDLVKTRADLVEFITTAAAR